MDFKDRKIDFHEADRLHEELIHKYRAGEINDRQFEDERKKLSVRDGDGRWWAKSATTGEWRVFENGAWNPGTPPGYSPPPSRTPQPQNTPGGPVVRERTAAEEKPSRRGWKYAVWAVLAVAMAAVAWGGVSLFGGGFGAAYATVEHDSGALSVEAPSDWSETLMEDSEGEKGRASWTAWIGNGDVGPALTAVNGLEGWRTGADGHQGMYMFASKELTAWENEYLVAAGPNDYWETCEGGEIQDFNRGEYSGKALQWKNCGGESDHLAVTLAASPEGRECVVVMQIGGYFRTEEDEAKIQHVLDTFEADCSKMP